ARQQHPVCVRPQLRRRVPAGEHPAGKPRPAADDRMPAAVVPLCAGNHLQRHCQRRISPAAAETQRFPRAVSAEDVGVAGGPAAAGRPGLTLTFRNRVEESLPMSFSMSSASVPAFEIGLAALSGVLDKAAAYAEAKKIDPSALLQCRLFPSMFT